MLLVLDHTYSTFTSQRPLNGNNNESLLMLDFFVNLFIVTVFYSVVYLMVAYLARLGILFQCKVSMMHQYLVRLFSSCWITGGHTIHPPIKELLPSTGTEPTPFRDSAHKVAGLQVHATILGSMMSSYCLMASVKRTPNI